MSQQTKKQLKNYKMKTQQIHVALLLITMAVSAYASGQQELIQADKYQIEETNESEIINDNWFGPSPHNENSNPFKALIYPNPSLTGKVRITWHDHWNVDQILIFRDNFDGIIEIDIIDGKEVTIDSLEDGYYYVKFYSKQKLLGTQKLKVTRE